MMNVRLQFVVAPGLAIALVGTTVPAAVRGQQAICGTTPQARTVELTASEKTLDIGEGLRTERWTFDGRSPGPTIEVCEGDTVKIVVRNEGKIAHGLDSHAFRIDASKFGPVQAGKTLTFEKKVEIPGVFMYHCANGPLTDQHIKMGMYGVMIVYSRKQRLRPALELVVSENGIYGEPDGKGFIAASTERMDHNDPYFVAYDGQLTHNAIEAKAGQLVRIYFVNAGPYTSAFHVIGTILDRAYESGNPSNVAHDLQTFAVPAGSGAMFELTIPEPGKYLLVDHDKLSQLPNGLGIPIVAH